MKNATMQGAVKAVLSVADRNEAAADAGVFLIALMEAEAEAVRVASEAGKDFFGACVGYSLSLITWDDIEAETPALLSRVPAPTASNKKATKYVYNAYHTAKSTIKAAGEAGVSLINDDGSVKGKSELAKLTKEKTGDAGVPKNSKNPGSETAEDTGADVVAKTAPIAEQCGASITALLINKDLRTQYRKDLIELSRAVQNDIQLEKDAETLKASQVAQLARTNGKAPEIRIAPVDRKPDDSAKLIAQQ